MPYNQLQTESLGGACPCGLKKRHFRPKNNWFELTMRFRMQNLLALSFDDDFTLTKTEARVKRLRLRFDGYIYSPKLVYSVQLGFTSYDTEPLPGGDMNIVRDAIVYYVPNATWMVVENADRFGLSQLHQLRGRVGRGKAKSYCILLSDSQNEETRARLKVMTQTNDGFRISQEDLRLRGPGDFFGQRQHGLPAMKIADLSCDMRLLEEAQTAARQLMERDPELTDPAHQALRRRIRQLFDTNADMLN